ncbi:hypothetical protein N878_02930 [Pseudomonas sp. EGD-AK9]|uniref:hypothetical protein n=1 Tax=Pseudomonas sp. EGD-AK9 TaxID=1386078 RepID=UPI0003970744|nr:hypothetical protein [Pseudomonas sp. EGD-AK9]ERI54122.1 hypothetical protein N878_02930 [Pseudomonas sp. EGD-AK9]
MLNKEFHIRFTVAGIARFLFSPCFVVPAVVLVLVVPWDGEHVPAWVQAIGSVLGIGAAVWVANRQRTDLQRDKLKQDDVVHGLVWLVADRVTVAGQTLSRLVDEMDERMPAIEPVEYWLGYLERELGYLRGVDFLRLPDPHLVHALLKLMSSIEAGVSDMRAAATPAFDLRKFRKRAAFTASAFLAIESEMARKWESLRADS